MTLNNFEVSFVQQIAFFDEVETGNDGNPRLRVFFADQTPRRRKIDVILECVCRE